MNNINFSSVEEAMKAMTEDRSLAMKNWKANISWVDGTQNKVKIRDFNEFIVDEPAPLGGTDLGPNPVEYLIAAAGSCFAITFQVMASQKGIKLNSVETEIEADLNAAVFLGIEEGDGGILDPKIRIKVDSSASDEELKNIMTLALSKSPVIISLGMEVELIR